MKKFYMSISGTTMEEDLKYVTFQLDRFVTRQLRPLGFMPENTDIRYVPVSATDPARAEQALVESVKQMKALKEQVAELGEDLRASQQTVFDQKQLLQKYAAEIADLNKPKAAKKKAPAKKKAAKKKAK